MTKSAPAEGATGLRDRSSPCLVLGETRVQSSVSPKVVLKDGVDGTKTIAPADFFTLGVGSAVVADPHLIDGAAQPGDFGGDFGLKPKAVFLQGDLFQDFPAEDFITGLHVGDIDVGQHVREQREETVADHVPEIDHAVRVGPHETRAKDDIGPAGQDGCEQAGILVGIVFEVGILHDDDVAGGGGEAGAERGALALVDLMVNNPGEFAFDLVAQDVAGPVGRTIVHDQDFLPLDRRGPDGGEDGMDGLPLVEAGNDDGKQWRGGGIGLHGLARAQEWPRSKPGKPRTVKGRMNTTAGQGARIRPITDPGVSGSVVKNSAPPFQIS